jgi:hypothetical protein
MKKVSVSLLVLAALVSAQSGYADPISGIDPRMIIEKNVGDCLPIFGLTFTFSANGQGGGFLDFINKSGVDWTNLLVTTLLPEGTSFPEDYFFFDPNVDNAFENVQATLNGNVLSILYFDAPQEGEGEIGTIFDDEIFAINLNNLLNGSITRDPDGSGGWGANHQFRAQANVPEPATWFLLVTGLAGLASIRVRRRWWGRRPSEAREASEMPASCDRL